MQTDIQEMTLNLMYSHNPKLEQSSILI